MAPPRLCLLFLLGIFVVAGCPSRFDPRAAQLASIHSQNPDAEADYTAALRKWQESDLPGAQGALKQFFDKHGHDSAEPLLPLAHLLEARVARGLGEQERARTILQPLSEPTASPAAVAELARFELGLVEYSRGEFAEARRLLAPFSGQIVDGDEATELHAVLANIYSRSDQPAEALREYEQFYRSPQLRPLEQVYIRSQVTALLPRFSATEQRSLRSRFGLDVTDPAAAKAAAGGGQKLVIGLVLPLSGKERALGERVLRGAYWAARGLGAKAEATPAAGLNIDLRVRDSGAMPSAEAVAELAHEGVQAIIGSPVRAESAAISSEAGRRGLLAVSLAPQAVAPGAVPPSSHPAQLLAKNESRAESLALHLRSSGLTSVAVLAPATPYGQSMTSAFTLALAGSAVQVVAQLSFPAASTTFTAVARQLLDKRPQALFIPATAQQLELIAGQLAAVGALATYRVEKRDVEPPIRLLLSTAEGMGERLLKSAGRYLQGAILAPISPGGTQVAGEDGRWSGYAQDGGSEPGSLDALGFDAVKLLGAACPPPASLSPSSDIGCTTEQLTAAMRTLSILGATGPIAFDGSGQRRNPAWLLRVDGGLLHPVERPAASGR